jgi:hypothetical protein
MVEGPMTKHPLKQVVAYIAPELKELIEQDRKRAAQRISMSAYVESILRRHFQRNRRKSAS